MCFWKSMQKNLFCKHLHFSRYIRIAQSNQNNLLQACCKTIVLVLRYGIFHQPSQKCELQSFVFQKVPIWQRPLANQLGGFEYNFRCLKRFFRKVRRKLRSAFFLKLRILKIRLLVTWLKCLFGWKK